MDWIPVAHIDDPTSVRLVLNALTDLHGADYEFHLGHWDSETSLRAAPECVNYYFLIETDQAAIHLRCGDPVRGPDPAGPYNALDAEWATVTADHAAALWPGDTITVDGRDALPISITGGARYFQVTAAATAYRTPRLAML